MSKHSTQIAIIGGGVCGLWLLHILRTQGFDAWLFEKTSLGGEQTIASQGMIHGGLKYALGGFTTPSSETIANMPATWRRCLNGQGPVDLSGLDILSNDYFLFSDGALSSKVTAFFASKSLQARITAVHENQYPPVFDHPAFKGSLYRLQDIVLSTSLLIRKLAEPFLDYIFQATPRVLVQGGQVTGLSLTGGDTICADRYIFAAGAGNQALIENTPLDSIKMQVRPLQQIMLKGKLPLIYAHAVSLRTVDKPRVTFTSHATSNETVWYLGGDLSERGASKFSDDLIEEARQELELLLPWIDLKEVRWATLNIDRIEAAQTSNSRPDHPFVKSIGNCMVCWPTKLTLTPMLGQIVLDHLTIEPTSEVQSPPHRPTPSYAGAPWELAFD